MKKNTGFTLVELMITMFIVGILLAVGVPSLKIMMQGNQWVATSNELVSALHVARSEAIKLNKKVTICISSDGTSCLTNSNKWQKGWIIFVDANGDQIGTGANCETITDINSDCLLRVHDAIDDSQLSVTGKFDSINQDIEFFTFSSRGLPKDNGAPRSGTLNVCSYDDSNNIIDSRAVVLGISGRVRVSDNPAAISCPTAP